MALALAVPFASTRPLAATRDSWLLLGSTVLFSLAILHLLAARGGWRRAGRFLGVTLMLAWGAEALGLASGGWLFGGSYHYHPGFRPVLPGGVPLVIPFAWFALAGMQTLLLQGWRSVQPDGRLDYPRLLAKAVLGAWGMVACDLALDPIAVSSGLWAWTRPGPYFGVPWLNFAGWWGVALVVLLAGYGWVRLDPPGKCRLARRHEAAWAATFAALLVLMGFSVFNRIGSGVPLLWSLVAMMPVCLPWLRDGFSRAGGGSARASGIGFGLNRLATAGEKESA